MDVENGEWAIYGARLGTYLTMLTDWDYNKVQDFDELVKLWDTFEHNEPKQLSDLLSDKLGLPMCMLSAEQSKFFKRHYSTDKHNLGPLVKEMDVIRKLEGW
jgi:DNA polymerase I-like protein with 3'-5' exonuclease and polymerase domains